MPTRTSIKTGVTQDIAALPTPTRNGSDHLGRTPKRKCDSSAKVRLSRRFYVVSEAASVAGSFQNDEALLLEDRCRVVAGEKGEESARGCGSRGCRKGKGIDDRRMARCW